MVDAYVPAVYSPNDLATPIFLCCTPNADHKFPRWHFLAHLYCSVFVPTCITVNGLELRSWLCWVRNMKRNHSLLLYFDLPHKPGEFLPSPVHVGINRQQYGNPPPKKNINTNILICTLLSETNFWEPSLQQGKKTDSISNKGGIKS